MAKRGRKTIQDMLDYICKRMFLMNKKFLVVMDSRTWSVYHVYHGEWYVVGSISRGNTRYAPNVFTVYCEIRRKEKKGGEVKP